MNPVAYSTEVRAAAALGTVKKRIRMCGSPAVPNISASPSEMVPTALETNAPGAMIAMCFGCTSTARANIAVTSKL